MLAPAANSTTTVNRVLPLTLTFHPRIDGGVPLDSAVESQQFRSHRRSTSRSATTNSRSFHRFVLGLGTDLRVHGPPLSEEFVYLSLAAEIEPESRRFAGTLESVGGVLSW